nr:hypothetical protein [Comamonas testosteroni]
MADGGLVFVQPQCCARDMALDQQGMPVKTVALARIAGVALIVVGMVIVQTQNSSGSTKAAAAPQQQMATSHIQ